MKCPIIVIWYELTTFTFLPTCIILLTVRKKNIWGLKYNHFFVLSCFTYCSVCPLCPPSTKSAVFGGTVSTGGGGGKLSD